MVPVAPQLPQPLVPLPLPLEPELPPLPSPLAPELHPGSPFAPELVLLQSQLVPESGLQWEPFAPELEPLRSSLELEWMAALLLQWVCCRPPFPLQSARSPLVHHSQLLHPP